MPKRKRNINIPEDLIIIKENLKDYTRVFDRHIGLIPSYYRIKYINKETGDYSSGGSVLNIKNGYIVIKITCPGKPIIYSVDPSKNIIYIEDIDKKIMRKKQKDNLMKLYDAGLLKLVD